MESTQKMQKQENPLWNLLFNIVIPVLILNKGSSYLTPLVALIAALSFPLIYGIIDFVQKGKMNPFSLLGLLNILFTGGLALMGLEGGWFALKEAIFPALIGVFVFISAFGKKPFIETLFMNPQIINIELIQQRLSLSGREKDLHQLLKRSTFLLSLSFALSAFLNFMLAIRIFQPIDPSLSEALHGEAINQQIAEMTKWSFVVILVPSLVFLSSLFYYMLHGLKKISGLTTDEIIPQK